MLTITPTHRRLALDARDGVRSWSLRLAPSERGLRVSDVRLFRSADGCDDESDESGNEEEEEEEEEEEQDDDDDDDGDGSGQEAAVRAREEERVGRVKRPPLMRVRLDKTDVDCRGRGRWDVTLGPGPAARVLELSDTRGGDGGEDPKGVWRVYLQCTA